MAEAEDLDIIEALVDANCRAYNEEFGFHYDSRCLDFYNVAIARLIEAGRVTGHKVSSKVTPEGKTTFKSPKLKATTEIEAEVVDINPNPRIRSTYIPSQQQVTRPIQDPMWMKWQSENAKLKEELAKLKGQA